MMKRVYFPPELWTMIYQYDNTYKKYYNECIQQMNSYFNHNIMISMMKACFDYYNIYNVNSRSYLCEKKFRWAMNEDPMATEKLSEGLKKNMMKNRFSSVKSVFLYEILMFLSLK